MANEIKTAIEIICEEKGLKEEVILETLNQALAAAYRKEYLADKNNNVKALFNIENGSIKVWDEKTVVEDMELDENGKVIQDEDTPEEEKKKFHPRHEIMLKDAKKIRKGAKIGDVIKEELESKNDFGRIAAQTAKQVIMQKLKEAEKEMLFSEYKDKEKTIISGVIQRYEKNFVIVNLGNGTATLPKEEQIESERYNTGARMKFYIKEVYQDIRGTKVILSRTSPELVKQLFTLEVPEITNGIVLIKSIAREAGKRTKMSVYTNQENIDPIGSCVGQRGIRINSITEELGGEKIDIIEYQEDIKEYIINALLPAKIDNVIIVDEKKKEVEVKVDQTQFSLAIGKQGQNVRLASKLTGWKINIDQGEFMEIFDEDEIEKNETKKINKKIIEE
ncbi:transcription termination factor NusA [Patescibacteria group bacterium]|nr:transcription termination factor NusA [Patescibacteria group bacterium]